MLLERRGRGEALRAAAVGAGVGTAVGFGVRGLDHAVFLLDGLLVVVGGRVGGFAAGGVHGDEVGGVVLGLFLAGGCGGRVDGAELGGGDVASVVGCVGTCGLFGEGEVVRLCGC